MLRVTVHQVLMGKAVEKWPIAGQRQQS